MNDILPKKVLKTFMQKLHVYSDEVTVKPSLLYDGVAAIIVKIPEIGSTQGWIILNKDEQFRDVALYLIKDRKIPEDLAERILKDLMGEDSAYFYDFIELIMQGDLDCAYYNNDYEGFETQYDYLMDAFNAHSEKELLDAMVKERIDGGDGTALGGLYECGYCAVDVLEDALSDKEISIEEIIDYMSDDDFTNVLASLDGKELELCDGYYAYKRF